MKISKITFSKPAANKAARRLMSALAAGLALAAPLAHAGATPNSIGLDSSLNLLVFKDFKAPSSDVEGRVAVGGNADMNAYTVNLKGPHVGATGLTVGGDLKFGGGDVYGNAVVAGNLTTGAGATFHGDVKVGGHLNTQGNYLTAASLSYGGTSNSSQSWQQASGGVSLGLNFAAEKARLSALSVQYDGLNNSGTANLIFGNMVFDGQGATLAVFDISAADASKNLELLNLGSNSTVLINVHGSTVDFGNHGYTNFNTGRVIFNLPEATSVIFNGGTAASFLAPLADFRTGFGVINGQVIANSWSGSVQVNDAPFTGTITAVPEPASVGLLLAGLGLLGWHTRRRARQG
jgi:choice-of-anchor A domain-containing protein